MTEFYKSMLQAFIYIYCSVDGIPSCEVCEHHNDGKGCNHPQHPLN